MTEGLQTYQSSSEQGPRFSKYVRSLQKLAEAGAIEAGIHKEIFERKSGNKWPAAFGTRIAEASSSIQMLDSYGKLNSSDAMHLLGQIAELQLENDALIASHADGHIKDEDAAYHAKQAEFTERLRKISEEGAGKIRP